VVVYVYFREDWVRNGTAQVVQEGLAHLVLSGEASKVLFIEVVKELCLLATQTEGAFYLCPKYIKLNSKLFRSSMASDFAS
jgi:hypothetical protein